MDRLRNTALNPSSKHYQTSSIFIFQGAKIVNIDGSSSTELSASVLEDNSAETSTQEENKFRDEPTGSPEEDTADSTSAEDKAEDKAAKTEDKDKSSQDNLPRFDIQYRYLFFGVTLYGV
jgi:hypothetical protein